MRTEGEAAHFGQGHDEAGLVAAESRAHAETGGGAGMADQRDEGLEGAERTPTPVLRDVTEQPVLEFHLLVPGGKCETWMLRPTSSARRCNAVFQPRGDTHCCRPRRR